MNEYNKRLNREFLFYHRDKEDTEPSTNLGNEMYTRLNELTSKLKEVPVVVMDKRSDKNKYSFKNKNHQPFGPKNSPSYLLSLMKSISNKKKINSTKERKKIIIS